jgi:protein-tyrosine-phosphatase
MSANLPGSVLFACSQNAIRSPMAEGLMKHFYGQHVFIDSCGVYAGENDPFVEAVLDEVGVDLSDFHSKTFDDLEDDSFDLVITLSPPAHHQAMELTRTNAVTVEYWPTLDPSVVAGSRDQILDSYRAARDGITERLKQRFGASGAGGV